MSKNPESNPWIGRDGKIAAPNAPAGQGGPGRFKATLSLGNDHDPREDTGVPHPSSPQARLADVSDWQKTRPDDLLYADLDLGKKRKLKRQNSKPSGTVLSNPKAKQLQKAKTQPPPVTVARTIALKSTPPVTVAVLADVNSTDASIKGAVTNIEFPGVSLPGYETDGKGKITKFTGTAAYSGNITIQTTYGPTAKPEQLSLYGRGTTVEDKKAGTVTLGFHESCHQKDLLDYLANHLLPEANLKVGMSEKAYLKLQTDFPKLYKDYQAKIKKHTFDRTDDVGYKKSKCIADKVCK